MELAMIDLEMEMAFETSTKLWLFSPAVLDIIILMLYIFFVLAVVVVCALCVFELKSQERLGRGISKKQGKQQHVHTFVTFSMIISMIISMTIFMTGVTFSFVIIYYFSGRRSKSSSCPQINSTWMQLKRA